MVLGSDSERRIRTTTNEENDAYSALTSDDDITKTAMAKKKAPQFPGMEGEISRPPSVHSATSVDELHAGDVASLITEYTSAERTGALTEPARTQSNQEVHFSCHRSLVSNYSDLDAIKLKAKLANVKIYMPFGGPFIQEKSAGTSFASNPFVSSTASQQASDRFDSEFQRFKLTTLQVSRQSQEADPTMDAQIQKLNDKNAKARFRVTSVEQLPE